MKKIDELRKEIDAIDKKMAILFNERLELVKKIYEVKKEMNLPVTDKSREQIVIETNLENINKIYQDEYIEFIKKVIEISKKIQK